MKLNIIQYLVAPGIILLGISCQKRIDNPMIQPEEFPSTLIVGNSNSTEPQQRPFKGQIVGSFVGNPTADPGIYHSIANASGNVTHLGVFTKVTSDVFDTGTSAVNGSFIMTSPGGEQITGTYSGTFTFGTVPGTFSWALDAIITGGSGRFLHANGEFIFIANGTYTITDGVVSGDYTETFDGIINY